MLTWICQHVTALCVLSERNRIESSTVHGSRQQVRESRAEMVRQRLLSVCDQTRRSHEYEPSLVLQRHCARPFRAGRRGSCHVPQRTSAKPARWQLFAVCESERASDYASQSLLESLVRFTACFFLCLSFASTVLPLFPLLRQSVALVLITRGRLRLAEFDMFLKKPLTPSQVRAR